MNRLKYKSKTKFMKLIFSSLFLGISLLFGCKESQNEAATAEVILKDPVQSVRNDGLQNAYFASGCFWCVEAIFESVSGVEEVVSGYSGGTVSHPTYRQVANKITGHAETVEVQYDPNKVSFETLVKVFYGSHDPTTYGQSPDFGEPYRSVIFYQNNTEKQIAENFKAEVQKGYSKKVVTEIIPFEKFWPAEDYHQNYEKLNPNNPYVQRVSIPRLNRFKAKFTHLLKK